MRQEVALEIVDEAHRLLKQFLIFTTVHQDGFGTEHLGHFSEYGCAALCNQEVAEHTQQRVGCDARETIGTTALETYTQFAQGYVGAYVLTGYVVNLTEYLHTFFHFVAFNLLGYDVLHTFGVNFTYKFLEHIRLVIFTSEAYYQHGTSIGVQYHVAQDFLRIFVIVAQLGATIVVRVGDDGIHALASSLLAQTFGQLVGNAVDTTYSGDNPHFVTYSHVTILATVALECKPFVGDVEVNGYGVVGVFEQTSQIGLDLVFVNPLSLLYIFGSVSDGVAILDDVFTFVQVGQHHFVSGRCILQHGDVLSVDGDSFSGIQCLDSHGNIVGRVNFQILSFHD